MKKRYIGFPAGKKRKHDPRFYPVGFYGKKDKKSIMSYAQKLRMSGFSLRDALNKAWSLAREKTGASGEKVINLKPNGYRVFDKRHDPWKGAIKGKGELLAIINPKPNGPSDKAIVEACIHVNRRVYNSLVESGEFDVLNDGVLARRGRIKKSTNIFIMPRGR